VTGDREVGVCFINSGPTFVSAFVFVVPFVLFASPDLYSSSIRTSRADCLFFFTWVSQMKSLIFVTS
jgi:hypothetical protein